MAEGLFIQIHWSAWINPWKSTSTCQSKSNKAKKSNSSVSQEACITDLTTVILPPLLVLYSLFEIKKNLELSHIVTIACPDIMASERQEGRVRYTDNAYIYAHPHGCLYLCALFMEETIILLMLMNELSVHIIAFVRSLYFDFLEGDNRCSQYWFPNFELSWAD